MGKVVNLVWESGHLGFALRQSLTKIKASLLSTCIFEAHVYSHWPLRAELFPSPFDKYKNWASEIVSGLVYEMEFKYGFSGSKSQDNITPYPTPCIPLPTHPCLDSVALLLCVIGKITWFLWALGFLINQMVRDGFLSFVRFLIVPKLEKVFISSLSHCQLLWHLLVS